MKLRPSRTSLYRLLLGSALMLLGWALGSMTVAQADDGGTLGIVTTSTESVTGTVDAAASEVEEVVEDAVASVNETTTKAAVSDPVSAPTTSTVKAVTTTVPSIEPTVTKTVAAPVREVTKTVAAPVRVVTKTVAAPVREVTKTVAAPVREVTKTVVAPVVEAVQPVVKPVTPDVKAVVAEVSQPTTLPSTLVVAATPPMLQREATSSTLNNWGPVVDRMVHGARTERAAHAELATARERLLSQAGDRARAMLAAVSESGTVGESMVASPVRAPGPSAPGPGRPTLGVLSGAPGSTGSSGQGSPHNATAAVNADLVDPLAATPPSSGELWMSPAPVHDPGSRPG